MWVSSEAKAGKDAGELAGLDVSTGITATNDLDAVLAAKPDARSTPRWPTTACPTRWRTTGASWPRASTSSAAVRCSSSTRGRCCPDDLVKPIEEATQAGKSSLFVNGIDPGFANDLLPLALAGTCQSIEQIRCMEIINYDTYDSADGDVRRDGLRQAARRHPDAAAARRAQLRVGFGGPATGRRPGHRTRRGHRDLRARARTRGLRHRLRPHREGHRRRVAVRGARHEGRQGRRRARTRHPAAQRPAPGLAATRAGRRLVPHRDHRRTVICGGPLPEQPQRRPQPRRSGRHGGPRRQRDPRRGGRCTRHRDDPGLAPHHWKRAVRCS